MADKLAHASVLNPRLSTSLSQKKIPSLDGLRAVAVLLVICHHLHVPFFPLMPYKHRRLGWLALAILVLTFLPAPFVGTSVIDLFR